MVVEYSTRVKSPKMFVRKRGGKVEPVMFDKITSRVEKLCYGLDMDSIDAPAITMKVMNGLYPGVETRELDDLAAETAIKMSPENADYAVLGARIAVSNLHKETSKSFKEVTTILRENKDPRTGKAIPLVSESYYNLVMEHGDQLNSVIIHDRDYKYSYFAFKELERTVLLKVNNKVVERPQLMFMRVALSIHGDDIDQVTKTYNLLSDKYYIHDISTLVKAGFPKGQLARAYSLSMISDSIEGIYDSVEECGAVARSGGEVGFNLHCIRATGSYIAGTNGVSNGLVPLLKVYNEVATFVHEGGMKSNAKIAVYVEPWHSDIYDFLSLKKANGKDEQRARNLSYGLWVPDLLMRRVEKNEMWSLMCPKNCPGLYETWGDKFEELYISYENQKRYVKQVKAQELWLAILESQVNYGSPFIMYKDACNRKTNHQNMGTIAGSNFTTEYVGYTSPNQTAASHGAALSLEKFVVNGAFDFNMLKDVTKDVTVNLNSLIDATYYTSSECETATKQLRPISIGVLGLADAFIKLKLSFDSDEAKELNKHIFETIYYGALEASAELANKYGPYDMYEGSPVSEGVLQYDMWDVKPCGSLDWAALKKKISQVGLRNSLLVGLMPTPNLSVIMEATDSFEPISSTYSVKNLGTAKFIEINKHLLSALKSLNLCGQEIDIGSKDSIADIDSIPKEIRDLFKTKWEISQKVIVEMVADRAPFIDQSQCLNTYAMKADFGRLNSMIFDIWRRGLKTGIHEYRTLSK